MTAFQRILVATDLSAPARRAAERGAMLSRQTQAALDLLHVADPARSSGFYTELFDRPPVETSSTFVLFVLDGGIKVGLWSRETVEPATGGAPGALEIGIALGTPAGYIGMIGSKRKVLTVYKNLVAAGFAPEAFGRVRAPVGLEIGAEGPEEIAVSVTAEMIAHIRGAAGVRPLTRIMGEGEQPKEAALRAAAG